MIQGLRKRLVSAAPSSSATVPSVRQGPLWPWVVFGVAAVICLATLLHLGRDLLFFLDEWFWILRRRDLSVETLLEPHVEHLSVVPVALYQVFFRVFGIADYTPYRVLLAGLHVATIALVFVSLRRSVSAPVALVGATVLLFFGAAWQDLLWAFQIGFVLSVAAGIGAFLLLDSDRPGSDRLAAVCALVALGSSSVGLPLVVGLGVELALRRDWRRWWIVGGPGLLYAAWYAGWGVPLGKVGDAFKVPDPDPFDVVGFAIENVGSTVGAMTGAGSTVGQILLIPLAAGVGFAVARATPLRRARLLALAAVPVVFSVSLGISRWGSQPPGASRYLYANAVFIVLLLAGCVRGRRVPTVALVALLAVGGWSVAWNLQELVEGRDKLLMYARESSVELGAVDIGVRGVDPEYAATREPPPRIVRRYIAAFEDLGFPGRSPAEIAAAPNRERVRADAFLVRALGLDLGAAGTPGGIAPTVTKGGPGAADGESCVVLRSTGARVDAELTVATSALRIEALDGPVQVRLRNFGDEYFSDPDAWATVHTGQTQGLRLPEVTAGPWKVGIHTAAAARLCGVLESPT